MKLAKSVSVEELSEIAEKAAHEIMGDIGRFGNDISIGKAPPGTIGLIWRDPNFDLMNPKEMVAISEKFSNVFLQIWLFYGF